MAALVTMIYYVDVLSSWCYVADRALERVREKYADELHFEWRIAQLFGGGPLPYTCEQLAWYYGRTAKATGVQLDAWWHQDAADTTLHANLAAEAVRSLGIGGDAVRRGLAHAAMIDRKPVGRREDAVAEAARLSGLPAGQIAAAMDSREVRERVAQTTKEFEDLALTQRPSFLFRDAIDDLAVFSGLYTFESFDAVAGEMIHASRINRDYGMPPDSSPSSNPR